ncbi:MAG: flavodoxin [Ruminococcus sp.]
MSTWKKDIPKECPDISGYDVIFLGFPNWWNTLPMPVVTFLEQCSWDGKKIIPGGEFLGHEVKQSEAGISQWAQSAVQNL